MVGLSDQFPAVGEYFVKGSARCGGSECDSYWPIHRRESLRPTSLLEPVLPLSERRSPAHPQQGSL